MINKILWRKLPVLIGFGRKEDTKERTIIAVSSRFSTETQLKKILKQAETAVFATVQAKQWPSLYYTGLSEAINYRFWFDVRE
jgi:hypothetical protein